MWAEFLPRQKPGSFGPTGDLPLARVCDLTATALSIANQAGATATLTLTEPAPARRAAQ